MKAPVSAEGAQGLVQLLRYAFSGALAASVHLLVFSLLLAYAGLPTLLASALGFLAAIGVNYPLQYFWTFRSRSAHWSAFRRYLAVTLGMLLLNLLLLELFLSNTDWPPVLTQALVIVIVFLLNFAINRVFTFGR